MNRSEFARLVGVSEAVVRKGLKNGRITLSADGTLDPETQVSQWHGRRDPAAVRTPGRPATATTPAASAAASASFEKLRSGKVALEIQLLQEELKKARSQTVGKDEVRRALTSFSRLIRDKWVNFPNRYGQQIAGRVGAEPKAVMAVLDEFIRMQLDEIANVKPTLPE